MRPRILVVDDSPQCVAVIEGVLGSAGLEISSAPDGQSGLLAMAQHPPDLLLLDLRLPDMSGFDFIDRLSAHTKDVVPVLFLSADGNPASRVTALGLGACDYVIKPFDHAELLARVRTHLKLSSQTEALRTMNDELLSARARDEVFTLALVHDIKNPLVPIISNLEWLASEPGLSGEAQAAASESLTAALQLHRIAMSLLDLRTPQRADERSAISIEKLLEPTLSWGRLATRSTPGRLRCVREDAAVEVPVDLVQRIVQNLIDNALKYSPAERPVTVHAHLDAGRLQVVVADEGSGIPAGAVERIFLPWERLDAAPRGHGIGLAFCRQTAERLGGSLIVEPNLPTGSRFCLSLPAAEVVQAGSV